jgi:uncharacterized protein (UPF0262 family)
VAARLIEITLDETGFPASTPGIDQERRVAIFDLLEENSFDLPGAAAPGPWRMTLGVRDRVAVFGLSGERGDPAGGFEIALPPLAQVMKDYVRICEDYFDAVRHRSPSEIEAMDEGRRAIHQEGARLLAREIDGKADMDHATLRRFFTLFCGLHAKT